MYIKNGKTLNNALELETLDITQEEDEEALYGQLVPGFFR